jgi:perosamine synthetase
MPWAKTVYWLYSILVAKGLRDKIAEHLETQGIESRPFFYPLHTLPPYKCSLAFPVAEELSIRGLNLPSGPELSRDQLKEVAESIREVLVD